MGMLGEEGVDVESGVAAAAVVVVLTAEGTGVRVVKAVVVLTAEGTGVRVVKAVVAAALSELDAAPPELLSVAVA
jgi:hypothetical protein